MNILDLWCVAAKKIADKQWVWSKIAVSNNESDGGGYGLREPLSPIMSLTKVVGVVSESCFQQ